jgi:GNAT superfamily N-acetyltransferase
MRLHPHVSTVRNTVGSPITAYDSSRMLNETVMFLEMTSASQLVQGRPPPRRLEMEEVGPAAVSVVRSTYVRIGAPHGWTGRSGWSDAEWAEELSRRGVRAWIGRVDEEVVGLVELEAEPNGDVGIVVFGLVSEFVGKGFGGAFLAGATRLAWEPTCSVSTRRVWVQTSSRDHPHARRNYERRGFRMFRTERRSVQARDSRASSADALAT